MTGAESGNSGNSGSASATITVQAPSCAPASPVVTLSPSETWIGPGGSAILTVSVTNRDSAACGTSSFNLAPTVPSGWTANLAGGSALSVSPGASASTALQVTAPASADRKSDV